MPDNDGPGSNLWDFLQTLVSHPTTVKIIVMFLGSLTIVVLIAMGVLDGNALVGWFKDVWHTLRGVQ